MYCVQVSQVPGNYPICDMLFLNSYHGLCLSPVLYDFKALNPETMIAHSVQSVNIHKPTSFQLC